MAESALALREHPQIIELLSVLEQNSLSKQKEEVQALVGYIDGMEEKLSQIELGQYTPEQFMGEIAHMITDLVNTYEIVEGAEALMRRNQNIGICPHCGSEVVAREKGWMCRNRECRFVLWKNSAYFKKIGKPMTEHMAARLIREKRLRLKDCQSQRPGLSCRCPHEYGSRRQSLLHHDLPQWRC